MVLYAIWWAMGQGTNKKTEPNKVLDFLDRHLLLVGCLLTFSALFVFVVSFFIGEIYITINTFDTGGFQYFYYDLNSPIFNILFDVPLVAGLYCFYGNFNRKGRLNKKILKLLWNQKILVIIPIIVFVFGFFTLINGLGAYHGGWIPTFNEKTNKPNTFDLDYRNGNITFSQDGNILDRNGTLLLANDNFFEFMILDNGTVLRIFKPNWQLQDFTVYENRIYLLNGQYYNIMKSTIEDDSGVIAYYDYVWSGIPSIFAGAILVFVVTPTLVYFAKKNY
jgi:magnesium-transporting ATPase (P-type)